MFIICFVYQFHFHIKSFILIIFKIFFSLISPTTTTTSTTRAPTTTQGTKPQTIKPTTTGGQGEIKKCKLEKIKNGFVWSSPGYNRQPYPNNFECKLELPAPVSYNYAIYNLQFTKHIYDLIKDCLSNNFI